MYMIILNHVLSDSKVATYEAPSFEGSTVIVKRPFIFRTIEEAQHQIQIEQFQCAAIVQVVDTYADIGATAL